MERPKDELSWSEETLIYVDHLEFEINRLKDREQSFKYSLDNAIKQNQFHEKERKKHIEEINRLKEEASEVDHADYCMCRYCNPEFHEFKKSQNKQK